jgi:pyridinium-3,5-bisthiocarboxylic acid mononucleotide nickel chelatase
MKTLYFDCFSGISGDMVIGALIDAGADPNILVGELSKLKIESEYELKWKKIIKNGISSTKFDVLLMNNQVSDHEHSQENEHLSEHVHDHCHVEHYHDEYGHCHELHHHEHEHEHNHNYEHHHHHNHEHSNEHNHHELEHIHRHEHGNHDHHYHTHGGHHHEHRSYKDIVRLIEDAGFSIEVEETALRIFKKIGEAEGLIHGIPLEQVHFHEVGAVDSIIDIVGAAILIHQLGISTIKSSPIPVGSGKIKIDHGIYPVPAPATLEILKGVPLETSEIRAELTTPTGAAIIAVLAEEFCSLPSFRVESIGYGAGTKTFRDHPNVLRAIIGESV